MAPVKKRIPELPEELIHQGSTHRKRLIWTDDRKQGNIATMNYAWIDPGKKLELHAHPDGEEYYVFLKGAGEMRVAEEIFPVSPMDFVTIPVAAAHSLHNTGKDPLFFITVRTVQNIP